MRRQVNIVYTWIRPDISYISTVYFRAYLAVLCFLDAFVWYSWWFEHRHLLMVLEISTFPIESDKLIEIG